jgi:deoxyribodipyrimidine photo-lyase
MKEKLSIFWFRRDLRLDDNTGLYHALSDGSPVLPLFIFDENILHKLDNKQDTRITFIYDEVLNLKHQLEKTGSCLMIRYGKPEEILEELAAEYGPEKVFTNHDYEPYARERDEKARRLLQARGIRFITFKDQVIYEKDEVLKDNGEPYTVFTPYSRKWKSTFSASGITLYPSENLINNFLKSDPFPEPDIFEIGFIRKEISIPSRETDPEQIANYHLTRDIPSIAGTSRLSVHLRFGTISIRKLVQAVANINDIFLNELIWREFYMMILWHFPHVAERSFKPKYDLISWRNNENEFAAWCNGQTGYPIVDAGMRELNESGYMHNRVRMVTASFLTKHLLTDWRWGEAYFAGKLLDFELASNNGGWQWAAGTGCDAAPYFRVFNPELQAGRFDPEKKYIRKWVPEFGSVQYLHPIVNHSEARNTAILAYNKALK